MIVFIIVTSICSILFYKTYKTNYVPYEKYKIESKMKEKKLYMHINQLKNKLIKSNM